MNSTLIGLHGSLGCGKDTAASFIREWGEARLLPVVRKGFADKLKYSAMTALGFVVSEEDAVVLADSLKEIGEITTIIPNQSVAYTIDGRKFLQLYGTEAHRNIFGTDFWVDALLPAGIRPNWHANFDHADICVITDVRFDNEAQRIRDLGGQVWKIVRDGTKQDGHSSEAGISPQLVDLIVPNAGTLEDFRDEVQLCCNSYLK